MFVSFQDIASLASIGLVLTAMLTWSEILKLVV